MSKRKRDTADTGRDLKRHKQNATADNDDESEMTDSDIELNTPQINWTPSLPFPADDCTLAIIQKHNDEYIIATDKKLYKFSLVTSQHTEWVDYGSNLDMESMALSIAFNEDTQTLCICDKQNLFTIANGTMSAPIALPIAPTRHTMFEDPDDAPLLFAEKRQIHVLFGQNNNKHFVWDIAERKWFTIKHFEHFSDRWYSGLVHLKWQKRLLIMGGVSNCNQRWSDKKILSYSLESNAWTELGLNLLCSVRCFGAVATRNDEFVLLFGGFSDEKECDDESDRDVETDTIHVLNVKLLQSNLSKIKCPETGSCFVFIDHEESDPRIVYGYVREAWKSQKMTDIPYPPTHLIEVLRSFYSIDFVHWVGATTRKHWKICVDDIVTNLS